MSKEIVHSVILIITVVLTFVFPKTPLAQYDLQISAGLFAFLYIVKRFFIKRDSYSRLIESVVFTLITLGIVNSTGGTASPFFFLTYFLLFSLSLMLEPIISITMTLSLIVFYLLTIPQNQDIQSLLPIISMAFLTPFALYMGQEHIEAKKTKDRNEQLQEDTFLFMSLMLKNHIKNIKEAVENYVGDHELDIIKRSANRMEKLIEKFEKN
jgi:signal transduction histidine kinase